MKPLLLKAPKSPTHSFSVRCDQVPYINNKWHYHHELELIYFRKGSGTRFIGTSIEPFQEGDVFLIGSNLPHCWRFDNRYLLGPDDRTVDVIVVHFADDFWGKTFLNLPENIHLRALFERARLGLKVSGPSEAALPEILLKMLESDGPGRLPLLLESLSMLAGTDHSSQISPQVFNLNFVDEEKVRMSAVYNFAFNNYQRKIAIHEVAVIAGLSSNSFCRYFKSRTGKTFTRFLNDLRINSACKHLAENKLSVKQICFESGFFNLASFHKSFKEVTGKSPLSFQRDYLLRSSS
jgi:AraC-like DNA-binding protein